MKKVGIIGFGVVGKAQAKFFQKAGIKPVICDPAVMLEASATKEDVNRCDFAFVCVPTPTAPPPTTPPDSTALSRRNLAIQGEAAADRLKPGLHTRCPSFGVRLAPPRCVPVIE